MGVGWEVGGGESPTWPEVDLGQVLLGPADGGVHEGLPGGAVRHALEGLVQGTHEVAELDSGQGPHTHIEHGHSNTAKTIVTRSLFVFVCWLLA